MSSKRYTEEFKVEAVKQVTERGYSVAEVAARLGTTTHSLYSRLKRYGPHSLDSNWTTISVFLHYEHCALERSNEKKTTQSFI